MHRAADVRFPHVDMADEDQLDLGNVGIRVLATPGIRRTASPSS